MISTVFPRGVSPPHAQEAREASALNSNCGTHANPPGRTVRTNVFGSLKKLASISEFYPKNSVWTILHYFAVD